ncbi:erg26, C-3 sterol dehydrogenase [Dispira parvispora]|uniref:Erg26, C-3 sterol dehydrogenase n=1 Tax=Dispira parvispora TaxID=1520584 RepID=A0A9W8AWA9_9FUNG|nr:erg26, C-3 sterol dehydrogenase [Dispira parvispora]
MVESTSSAPVYLVIGGGGFLGSHIVDLLSERHPEASLRILDLRVPNKLPHVEYFLGDICDPELVDRACAGVTTVIHTASPHPGSPRAIMRKVNVEGTANVIRGCQTQGVGNLIYTSSSSVVMPAQGQVVNADETLPYPSQFADYYGETKAQAEELVLKANGEKALRTCSLRPAGIFGPRDQQMVPKGMASLKRNAHRFQLGSNRTLTDFTYVTNVAHAHTLAVEKLPTDDRIAGEAFFITNDSPVLFWDQLRGLWSLVSNDIRPWVVIPDAVAYAIYYLVYYVLALLSLFIPGFKSNAAFVIKLLLTHRFYNITKAKTLLGYHPIVSLDDGYRRSVEWYLESQRE